MTLEGKQTKTSAMEQFGILTTTICGWFSHMTFAPLGMDSPFYAFVICPLKKLLNFSNN
jgi:hypothetical protein